MGIIKILQPAKCRLHQIAVVFIMAVSAVSAQVTGGDEAKIIAMLKEFYSVYITGDHAVRDVQDIAIRNRYFTEAFLAKLDKAELYYDPILDAQDSDVNWLKSLKIGPVAGKENTFRVCYSYTEEETNCVTLFIVKIDGQYLINGIEGL
jgi:hypothetical protein